MQHMNTYEDYYVEYIIKYGIVNLFIYNIQSRKYFSVQSYNIQGDYKKLSRVLGPELSYNSLKLNEILA